MPRQVSVAVQCGEQPLAPAQDVQRVSLTQSLFDHHRFEVVVPFDRVESAGAAFVSDAPARLLGQALTLQLLADAHFFNQGQQLQFKGLVTHLSAGQDNDYVGSVRVSGYSPCQLLASGYQKRTFRGQTLAAIFTTVLAPFPTNVLTRTLAPLYQQPIPYVVQYQETNYAFLRRLAAEYGEWLYYDGQHLRLGPPPAEEGLEFWADGHYNTFRVELGLRPTGQQLYAYDYTRHEQLTSTTQPQHVPELAKQPLLHTALGQSAQLYQAGHHPPPHPVQSARQLDQQAALRQAATAAGLVTAQGTSDNPALQVGRVLIIRGKGLGSRHQLPESFGAYRILTLTHTVDQYGNYGNTFTAVPVQAAVPPAPLAPRGAAAPELAEVIDDQDPARLGRLKVRYYWPVQHRRDAETDWIRVLTPYSGDGKGQLFNPEIGSQVLVAYQDQVAEQPVVLGNLFHAANAQGAAYSRRNNHVKGLQTKAGNKITMNDALGAMTMLLSNSNKKSTALQLGFDGDGNVTIKTLGPVHVSGSTITLDAGMLGEIHMHARRISLQAEQEIVAHSVAKDITLIAKERLAYQGKLITGKAEENMHLDGGQQLTSSSDDSRYL
ncbi:type VI secretion system Vgr family protein [Hymenobacter weizhouensis]|uniref:type VI secretion system Vgr family protein n=1 Tax=Hymenobacter sp. YIM 151500-1 TaxID=2987689 RepID=UPI0022277ECF|nr:contractile injection system protein, VgrG/Pvc8 family [Hymenobacter sp. YIM 151500-1]UYZ62511.1 contractile injection system protein, VgrG/Pvc8 family [Hymenobacter sp. YIM 151500-1]